MHRIKGTSGKTLHRPDIVEVLGQAILGIRNPKKKVRTLTRGRLHEGTTHAQISDTAGTSLTNLSERLLVDSETTDTIYLENHRLDLGEVMSPSRYTQGERERGK